MKCCLIFSENKKKNKVSSAVVLVNTIRVKINDSHEMSSFIADESNEMPDLIFSENKKKIRVSSAVVMINTLRVKINKETVALFLHCLVAFCYNNQKPDDGAFRHLTLL